jgi:hypothetical protein
MQTRPSSSWSSSNLFPPPRRTWFTRLLGWWYRLTALPPAAHTAPFAAREAARRSRLISSIVGVLLLIFLGFLPACLVLPNRYVLLADSIMLLICPLVLVLGKQGRVLTAGMLLTLSFEAALTMVILTTNPFDEASIQQYELFVFGELFAVSLLPTGSVFGIACYNSGVITWSLLFQWHTPYLEGLVHTQSLPLWVRPVAVQWLVATVAYQWVSSALSATRHADQAEIAAQLEHYRGQKQQAVAEARTEIIDGLHRLLCQHVELINETVVVDVQTPIPLRSYPRFLWPLVNAFNLLHRRLLAARATEKELHRLRAAIQERVAWLEQGRLEDLRWLSGTELDALVSALAHHRCLPGQTSSWRAPYGSPSSRKEER